MFIEDLPEDWASYKVQKTVSKDGSPTEMTVRVISTQKDRDIVLASSSLQKDLSKLSERGMQTKAQAPDTVTPEEYKKMSTKDFEM